MTLSLIGQTIGQYLVVDRVGHGGMGTVYRAIDQVLEREVALKVLSTDFTDPQRRLRAEAVTLARLRHPGIATVHALFQHDDHWVMVMEFVRGQTLEDLIERTGGLAPERAAALCIQALLGLAHAHDAGVVHRDLKPGNLMITPGGEVKILDFGIARVEGTARLTHAGFMMGTPAYMAPEQIQGFDVDGRADLYAIGVIFFRLVTGELPFLGETAFAVAQSQVNDPPRAIDSVRPGLPAWVPALLARALEKTPAARFQTATEFREALAQSVASAPPVSSPRPPERTEQMSSVRAERLTADRGVQDAARFRPWSIGRGRDAVRTLSTLARRPRTAMWVGLGAAILSVGVWQRPPHSSPQSDPAIPTASRSADPRLPLAAVVGARSETRDATVTSTGRSGGAATELTAHTSVAAATTPPAMFTGVKLLLVDGRRTTARDVLLTFSADQILAIPDGGGAPIATLPIRGVTKATYVHAAEPRWDSRFPAPSKDIDVPGFLARSRHWLVLQTPETFAILQLDGDQSPQVLKALTTRSGVRISRPSATK